MQRWEPIRLLDLYPDGSVEIGSLCLARVYLDNGVQREEVPVTYQDLNWVIPVG